MRFWLSFASLLLSAGISFSEKIDWKWGITTGSHFAWLGGIHHIQQRGLVSSGIKIHQDIEPSPANTYSIGLRANFYINNTFSFEPGLAYTQFGSNTQGSLIDNGTIYQVNYKVRLNYLQIPLLFKAGFGTGLFKFSCQGGINTGISTGGYEYLYVSQNPLVATQLTSISRRTHPNYSSVDAGLVVGVSTSSYIKKVGDLFAELSFNQGILIVYNNSRNASVSFNIGFLFDL